MDRKKPTLKISEIYRADASTVLVSKSQFIFGNKSWLDGLDPYEEGSGFAYGFMSYDKKSSCFLSWLP
jgi:hypothetical protein